MKSYLPLDYGQLCVMGLQIYDLLRKLFECFSFIMSHASKLKYFSLIVLISIVSYNLVPMAIFSGSNGVSGGVSLVTGAATNGDSGSMSFSTGVGSSGVGAEIFPLLYKFW